MLDTHWDHYAESWTGQSMPLRPSNEDLQNYKKAICAANAQQAYADLFILGTTPEIYRLGVSMGYATRAIDHSESMIDSIWPGPPGSAIHGDWREIDQSVSERAIVACDGGLHLLEFDDQLQFISYFQSGPLSESALVLRLFLPPTQPKSVDEIFRDFEIRKPTSISYLKVALWHSPDIQNEGITRIRDVWQAVHHRAQGDVSGYLTSLGQSREAIDSFLVYRDSSASYYFHSLPRIHEMMNNMAKFKPKNIFTPTYPEGQRFPVVIYTQQQHDQ